MSDIEKMFEPGGELEKYSTKRPEEMIHGANKSMAKRIVRTLLFPTVTGLAKTITNVKLNTQIKKKARIKKENEDNKVYDAFVIDEFKPNVFEPNTIDYED